MARTAISEPPRSSSDILTSDAPPQAVLHLVSKSVHSFFLVASLPAKVLQAVNAVVQASAHDAVASVFEMTSRTKKKLTMMRRILSI